MTVVIDNGEVICCINFTEFIVKSFNQHSCVICMRWTVKCCTRLQLYRQCDPTVNQLVENMESKLFTSVINNDKQVLSHILPDPNNHTYNLRPRRHELTLAIKGDARNFFERQLFKDIY